MSSKIIIAPAAQSLQTFPFFYNFYSSDIIKSNTQKSVDFYRFSVFQELLKIRKVMRLCAAPLKI